MSKARNLDGQKLRKIKVRRTPISNLPYEQMSDLGRDLVDISREYESSGEQMLSEEEIETELTRRRGGYTQDAA
ncbi:MAG TPA: hypothetical protein VJS44_16760 [Pyrinomonadaceae bacterium]|nr:hypothetical protein [Pyrinomonadaceae bacterium]